MYTQIKASSDVGAKVFAVGYPQITASRGNCALNVHFNGAEIAFSQLFISYLNQVVQQAAAQVGIGYLDVENAFDGFRLCEPTNPLEAAVNGLTAGDDLPRQLGGPIANESYHPTAFGQSLIAQAVLQQNGFSQPMPAGTACIFTARTPPTSRLISTAQFT
jgi:hypothetical protein